jgi:trigger factor
VRRKELPPLDDAFARLVSEEPTLQALRERLRARLAAERADQEERDLRERVLDAVLSQAPFDLPESMVLHEMEHTLDDLNRRLRGRGLSLETYLRSQGKDEGGLRDDLRPAAERRVRVRLFLDEVAKHEGWTLTEEEMARAVENLAQESGEEVQKMQSWLAQGDRLAGLREHLLRQKAMTTLTAYASGTSGAGEVTAPPIQIAETPDASAG